MSSSRTKPAVLIISGPSGAGKTTLSLALTSSFPDIKIAVSHTTRLPRPGEENAKDYFFVSHEAFQKQIESGGMLEYAEVYENFYGTSRDSIDKTQNEGKSVILDIDWQGAQQIKKIYPDAISFFILPPAGDEAKNRLLARQQDTEQTIQMRMSVYQEQISHQDEYDYVITNTDIQQTTQQLQDILRSHRVI